MATDGLLNDNREERKKKEFFEKLDNYGFTVLCEECKIEGCNQEPDQDLVWNWIQAYVKEEVARVDNSALVEEVLKVETNDV